MKRFGKKGIAMLGCLVLMLSLAMPAFALTEALDDTGIELI